MRIKVHFILAGLLGFALPGLAQHAVTTVAGGGATNVPAKSASIGTPLGMAFDKAGSLYIADSFTSRILKVSAAGTLTVVAGNGGSNYLGGGEAALASQLGAPSSVAVDSSGNIFIVDPPGTGELLEVNAKTGILSSAYPPPYYGSDISINQVFIDGSGHIYIVQSQDCVVAEVNLTAITSTIVAGTLQTCGYTGDGGAATSAELNSPGGLFVDASGDLFIADTGNNVVREVVAKTGAIKTIAGNGSSGYSGDGQAATSAELSAPGGVVVDAAGDILIADTGNNAVRKVTAGKISTIAGNGKAGYTGDGGVAASAELNAPAALLLDASQDILISDSGNSAIRKITAATKVISTYAGNGHLSYSGDFGLAANAQLDSPSGVSVDSFGNLFIADQYNSEIREVGGSNGEIKGVAGSGKAGYSGDGGPAAKAQVNEPFGVFVDAAENVFIADTQNHAIRKVTAATGIISTVAGNGTHGYSGDGGPATSAQLNEPAGVAVDRAGDIFIADSSNNVIREVVASTGVIKTVAGTGQFGYRGDNGLAVSAELEDPSALQVDASGNLFIADTGNNVIREVAASTGKIATIAGNGTRGFSGMGGLATSAELSEPTGIYLDGAGNVFVTQDVGDLTNYQGNVVLEVSAATHKISIVAGGVEVPGLVGPSALSVQFAAPLGLAGDRLGNLYVADSQQERIAKIAGIQGADPTPLAPPPTFTPAPGVYPSAQTVTLKDAASGAAIHFTTNGTAPSAASTKYTTPLAVAATTTVEAVATGTGDALSPVALGTYTISAAAPAPVFSPAPGTYVGAQTIALTSGITGATIRYTTNGSTPTATSPAYTGPIAVSKSATIKASAFAAGFKTSAVGSGAYTIETQVAQPVFTPAPRGYWTAQAVKLTAATAGAAIYYTLDGSMPNAKSTKYAGAAIPVSKTTTIKAIAVASGDLTSAVATGLYTIENASLVEQRALMQQGIGIGLATQTFLSQLSMSENVLLLGQDGNCGDGSSTLLSLTQTGPGHQGGIIPWVPDSPTSPGYGTIYYDNACTQPWETAELDNWTADLNLQTYSLTGSTSETAHLTGLTGAPLGTMQLAETIDVALTGNTLASTDGLGVFTPANGAPPAQLGLACTVDLLGFLLESEPATCFGGMAQDFPSLDLSLGFVLPISFTPVNTPGIAWTGSQFVATSALGSLFTSVDGSKWAAQNSGTVNNLRAAASSGSLLVAVGSNGTILTSTNGGVSWTKENSGTTANLVTVVWSGKQFVATGIGAILSSPDGVTWTSHSSGTDGLYLTGLVWSGKEFVAVGYPVSTTVANSNGGTVLTSPDGITWTENSPAVNGGTNLIGVTWSGTEFVAVGGIGGDWGQPTIIFSTDGKNWKMPSAYVYTGAQNDLNGVVWSPQKKLYVGVGNEGTIVTSSDLQTWTLRTSNTTFDLKSVVWSGTQFVAIGSANSAVTSPDGINWTARNTLPGYGALLSFASPSSSVVSGPLGGLQMTAPTTQTLAITGGTAYGAAAFKGYAGDLVVFVPTPTGWTATDAGHDQKFEIALGDNTKRIFSGGITQISTGKALSTFTVDRSGTGSVAYSDGSKAAIVNWLPAD